MHQINVPIVNIIISQNENYIKRVIWLALGGFSHNNNAINPPISHVFVIILFVSSINTDICHQYEIKKYIWMLTKYLQNKIEKKVKFKTIDTIVM